MSNPVPAQLDVDGELEHVARIAQRFAEHDLCEALTPELCLDLGHAVGIAIQALTELSERRSAVR